MIDSKMTLECNKNGVQKSVHCKSKESNARRVLITLVNNSNVVDITDLTFSLYLYNPALSSSQYTVLPSANLTKVTTTNTLIFTIPGGLDAGEIYCELNVEKTVGTTTQRLFSPEFRLVVEESIGEHCGTASEYTVTEALSTATRADTLPASTDVVIIDKSANVIKKIDWTALGTAENISYDNDDSGLTADTVQEAIDELKEDIPTADSTPTASSTNPVTSGGVYTALGTKQDTLTAGTNVVISGSTISANSVEVINSSSTVSKYYAYEIDNALKAGKAFSYKTSEDKVYALNYWNKNLNVGWIDFWYYTGSSDGEQVKYLRVNNLKGFVDVTSSYTGKRFLTDTEATSITAISGKEDASNKVTSLSSSSTDTQYPSAKATYDAIDAKQNTLTAGTNITITNDVISASGGDVIYTELYDEDYETSSHFTLYTGNEIRTMWNAKTPMCYKGYPIIDLADATSAVVIYWVQSASTNTQVILKRKTINNSEYGTIYEYDNLYNFVNPSAKIDKPSTATDGQVLTWNDTSEEWEAQTAKADAQDVYYDNTQTGYQVTNVQDAIDTNSSLLSQKANKGTATVNNVDYTLGRHTLTVTDGSTTTSYNFLTAEVSS